MEDSIEAEGFTELGNTNKLNSYFLMQNTKLGFCSDVSMLGFKRLTNLVERGLGED